MKFCHIFTKTGAILSAIAAACLAHVSHARIRATTTTSSVAAEEVDMLHQLAETQQLLLGNKKNPHHNGMGWRSLITVNIEIPHVRTDNSTASSIDRDGVIAKAFQDALKDSVQGVDSTWGFADMLFAVPEDGGSGSMMIHEEANTPNLGGSHRTKYGVVYSGGGECRLCPDDAAAYEEALGSNSDDSGDNTVSLSSTNNNDLPKSPRPIGGPSFQQFISNHTLWRTVSTAFCSNLQDSGTVKYSDVDNCSVRCGYASANDVALLQQQQLASRHFSAIQEAETAAADQPETIQEIKSIQGSTNAEVLVRKVKLSHNTDFSVIINAFIDAYNQVHEDSSFQIESLEILRHISAPESASISGKHQQDSVHVTGSRIVVRSDGDDDDENDDDDDHHSTATYVIDMYWVKATWSCTATDCGSLPGAAALAMNHELKLHQYSPNYHRIFQSLFCHNLRVSDDPVYDDATGCSITFDV